MPNRFKKNGMHAVTASAMSERLPQSQATSGMGIKGEMQLVSGKNEGLDSFMEYILDHPGISLGTALALGVLFGWLLKRK